MSIWSQLRLNGVRSYCRFCRTNHGALSRDLLDASIDVAHVAWLSAWCTVALIIATCAVDNIVRLLTQ